MRLIEDKEDNCMHSTLSLQFYQELSIDDTKFKTIVCIQCFAWIYPGHRGDSSIYANKGLASTWSKRETTIKTAETACLTAANRTMRQGETILEVYCASGNRRRSFFGTEGEKLANSLFSLKTFRCRFTPPKIL